MRKQARKIVQNWISIPVMIAAQNDTCPVCGGPLLEHHALSIDHVLALISGGGNAGNLLLAHERCNRKKGDAEPSEFALDMLDLVNACLGFDPALDTGYTSAVKGTAGSSSLSEIEITLGEFLRFSFSYLLERAKIKFNRTA